MNSLLLKLIIVLSSLWFTNGLLGFHKGKSLIFREPPITNLSRNSREVTEEFIEQRVDNFDHQNNDTYRMRYYRNDEFFKPGSPIFIYVGGEWTISAGSLLGGRIYELAKEFNGQLYYTEHRYYGKSHPTPDSSIENLRFLSVDQALADLAHFIVEAKKELGREKSPVIIVGGSYSATMVTWFRQKYPHLAVGAWASSAPLFAKLDFIEYKEVVGAAIHHLGGPRCYQLIENAFHDAEQLINERAFEEFRNAFGICNSFDGDNVLDVWTVFSLFTDIWAGFVQYHNKGDMDTICREVIGYTANYTSDFQAFAHWFRDYFWLTENLCVNVTYDDDVKDLQETEWGTGMGKQWLYQTCSEFGWYQTSGSRFQPFGSSFPIDLNYILCKDIFGFNKTQLEEFIAKKNTMYGGWNPAVENVFFTHGEVDPWRTMGVQTTINEKSPAAVISEASHCQDMQAIHSNDNEEMLAAKQKIRDLVKEWIITN